MKISVIITLKKDVLDPQGKVIHQTLDGMGFDNKRSCQDTISALIDKERWGDYLSSLESTETKECFKSLKAQPKDSCDERSMDVKDWADSIDFNECDAVYLFPVVGEWNGSCTNPATGEVRGFSLDIEVSSGEVEADFSSTSGIFEQSPKQILLFSNTEIFVTPSTKSATSLPNSPLIVS